MESTGVLTLVDSVSYPYMESNLSYARVPDGSSSWTVQPPTWNAFNTPSSIRLTEDKPGWMIYPSIVHDHVFVHNAIGQAWTITDLTGTVRATGVCHDADEPIVVSHFPSGLYLIRINAQTSKFIKR
jgi:hypothetical protein